jgi:hypothetical protein
MHLAVVKFHMIDYPNAGLLINPDTTPSIVPYEDPDQLPGHGRFGQAY